MRKISLHEENFVRDERDEKKTETSSTETDDATLIK